ncbi:MAG: hypothetical protein IPP88_21960 [Betaproteobacteria bacterium]|nr:hypothetical protein [Betaproteobacteria bacterium]
MSSQSAAANKIPGAYLTEAEGLPFSTATGMVSNRKMKEAGQHPRRMDRFRTKAKFATLLDGLVSVEELRNDKGRPFSSTIRTFDREKRTWS